MTKPRLLELQRGVLVDVAEAIRNGTLKVPVTETELRPYAGDTAPIAAAEIARLGALGMSGVAIAETFALVGASLHDVEQARDEVEFVWSGPEHGVTQTRETSVVVDALFRHAERDVLLATYAIYDGQTVFQALADRMTEVPTLRVRFFVHIGREKNQMKMADSEVLRAFALRFTNEQWPQGTRRPELFYDPRTLVTGSTRAKAKKTSLHAKCIVVDGERAFVTSANFTEAAQQRNIEAGVLVENKQFAKALREQFDMLLGRKLLSPLKLAAA